MIWPRFEVKNIIRFGSLFLIFAGLGVLLAWLFQWRAVLCIVPDGPVMTCDTAIGIVIAGLAFHAALRESTRLLRALGMLLCVLGAVYLTASLTDTWLSIHSLFPDFTARVVAPLPFRSCRTAPASAIVFVQLGAFLVLMGYAPLGRYSLNVAAFLASATPSLGLLGGLFYLAGLVNQRTWTVYLTSMSLPTALCALVAGACGCALFWIRTERSERRLFSTSATLSLLGLSILFVGVNSAVFTHGRLALRASSAIESTARQIDLVEGIVGSVRQAEIGERGFLLTNSQQYLQTYETGIKEIADRFAVLRHYPSLQTGLLQARINAKLAELAVAIKLQSQHQSDKALTILNSGAGLSNMKNINAEAARLLAILEVQRTDGLNQNSEAMRVIQKTVILSSTVAAAIILLAIVFLHMEVLRRTHVEEQLRDNSRDLQSKVEERTEEIRKYSDDLRTEALHRQEASDQLQHSLELAKVAVWTAFPDTGVTHWDGPVEEIFGRSAEQLRTQAAFHELVIPSDREYVQSVVADSSQHGRRFECEFRILLPNGESRWIAGMGNVVLDQNGQIARIAGINMDISARKEVEQKLATSELYFRGLAESMPQIVWAADSDGVTDYHNDQWSRVTGLPKGRLPRETRHSIVHPDDLDSAYAIRQEGIRRGLAHDAEFRLFDVQKQEYRWYWLHAAPVRDNDGVITRWFGTATDIHERKITELRLAESERHLLNREKQLALVFQNGSVGNYVWKMDKSEIEAHPAVYTLFGEPIRQGSASADWFVNRVHPDDRHVISRAIQTALRSTRAFDVEARVITPDGSIRWLASRGFAGRDKSGRPTEIHGLVFDITDTKVAALQVQESERHFREMADAMPQIVWRSAPSGEIDYCNARFYEYTGFSKNEPISWDAYIHPDDLSKTSQVSARGFAKGLPFENEFRLRRASDNAYRWHLSRSVPYRDLQGNLLRWFGAATDIHEKKLSEDRLEAEVQQRTSALQQLEIKETQLTRSLLEQNTLFHEMHHRVKNNLTVVSSLLRMQADSLKDPAAAAALKESHQRVLSMALIHEQLYTNRKLTQIDFEQFTRTLINELFQSYVGGTDRITCRLNTAQVFLKIDNAIPLGLILNELTTNALKYAYPKDATGEVVVDLVQGKDHSVTLSISDQGVGLPDGFDWTNSTSMGLPIVEMLTQQLGGTLTVRCHPGAAFTINFPADTEPEKADAVSAA